MKTILFLLLGWFQPLPPAPRPPGTIGVVCVMDQHQTRCSSDGLKGRVLIRNVDIGIWVMEKSK